MQNTFSQSGNDSKWFLKKSFFKIGMWHSRPPRDPPPPFMANAILNFHFDYWHTSLIRDPERGIREIRRGNLGLLHSSSFSLPLALQLFSHLLSLSPLRFPDPNNLCVSLLWTCDALHKSPLSAITLKVLAEGSLSPKC